MRDLRILVVTANLGNARPDRDSIAALIPEDGQFSEVVDNQKYPIPTEAEQKELLEEIGFPPALLRRSTVRTSSTLGDIKEAFREGEQKSELNVTDWDDYFDIIVVGLQEATFDVANDDPILPTLIQPILNKTFFKALSAGAGLAKSKDHTRETNVVADWLNAKDSKVLGKLLQRRCPSYDFVVRFQRGEMRLEILARNTLKVDALSIKAQNTGIGINGIMNAANKGGIIAELLVENSTRLTFCTAHLQAHEGKDRYHERCRMSSAILEGTTPAELPFGIDLALRSHYTFMLGDLNFRTELPNSESWSKEKHISEVMKLVKKKDWRALNRADELFKALREKDCLASFKTLPCIFPPTFKVERSPDTIYKDQRRPSYTDRILWRALHKMENKVKACAYEPVLDFSTSDHKPVRGAFEVQLNHRIQPRRPMLKKRLSTSMRDLYTEYTKRMGGAANTKLNFFVSHIKCKINKRAMAPDPYVVFMSFPHSLVQKKEKKFARFKNKLLQKLAAEEIGGSKQRTKVDSYGFPRTKRVKGTYTPQWLEELHLVVQTHDKEGAPLDMTGSIMHLVVIDKSPTIESKVIGAFPLNLAHLLESSGKAPEANGEQLGWGSSPRASLQGNSFDSSSQSDHSVDNRVVRIKQPLMKNGKETGWISVCIDAKWLTDSQAASEMSRRRGFGRGNTFRRLRRKSELEREHKSLPVLIEQSHASHASNGDTSNFDRHDTV